MVSQTKGICWAYHSSLCWLRSGAETLALAEVEDAVRSHPRVQDVMAFPVEHRTQQVSLNTLYDVTASEFHMDRGSHKASKATETPPYRQMDELILWLAHLLASTSGNRCATSCHVTTILMQTDQRDWLLACLRITCSRVLAGEAPIRMQVFI